MADKTNELAKKEQSQSERFTMAVMKEFGEEVSTPELSDYQRRLVQGYFIGIDRALKLAEENRVRKNATNKDHDKYDNNVALTWKSVNLPELAIDVMHYAKMGLDMMQDNHLSAIPFKNNKTGQYDITLMPGYNGIRYMAERYAMEKPIDVTIELVYDTDHFVMFKKSASNPVEKYEFEVTDPFNRGNVKGGFGYIQFKDASKNKLVTMSLADIMKRKPKYAAAEFWGGTKKEWVDGKQVEVVSDGWFDEMCRKTLIREVYSAKYLPRDPQKIDDHYQYSQIREAHYAELAVDAEIHENANKELIGAADDETYDVPLDDSGSPLQNTEE